MFECLMEPYNVPYAAMGSSGEAKKGQGSLGEAKLNKLELLAELLSDTSLLRSLQPNKRETAYLDLRPSKSLYKALYRASTSE